MIFQVFFEKNLNFFYKLMSMYNILDFGRRLSTTKWDISDKKIFWLPKCGENSFFTQIVTEILQKMQVL